MDEDSSLSLFSVDGALAVAVPTKVPPPWIPQGPRSLSSAAVEPVVPSIFITGHSKEQRLTRATLRFHNLDDGRARQLAEAFEKAAKDLRHYRSNVLDPKDPGVEVDVSAALVRRT